VVALSPRNSHSFLSQDVADTALGDRHLELGFEEIGQFLLREGQVLPLLLPQPSSTLRSHLVSMPASVINERLPGSVLSLPKGRASLVVATAEIRKRPPAEGKAQFLAEGLKVLSLVEAQEELLLPQSSFDLTGGVSLHGIPPEAEIAP